MFKSFYDGSDIFTDDDHLEHHGILGMHWGIRRFQPYPEGHKGGKEIGEAAKPRKRKLSKEARKRAKMRSEAADLKARTKLDEARAEAARARINATSAENLSGTNPKKSLLTRAEIKKQKAIKSGDPNKVNRYAKYMTTDEYKEAITRCELATSLSLQSLTKASKIGETIASGLSSAARGATSVISLQNSIADVRNAMTKSTTKWKKWGEKDDKIEKEWAAKKRKWEEEDRSRDLEKYQREKERTERAEKRESEKYQREKERAERDEEWNRYRTMFEFGFDPETGQRLADMPDKTLYKVFDDYRTKNKRGMSDEDFEKMLKKFGVVYD